MPVDVLALVGPTGVLLLVFFLHQHFRYLISVESSSLFRSVFVWVVCSLRCCCTSQNAIYLIECKRYSMQYIGQTNQKVSRRTNSHSFGINANDGQGYATYVALYFNTDFHSLEDFRFVMVISTIDSTKSFLNLISKFNRRFFDLVSKFNVGLKCFCNKAYRNLNYDNLLYKFRKNSACIDFSTQSRKIILRYRFGTTEM